MSVEIRGLNETLAGVDEYGRQAFMRVVDAGDECGRALENYAKSNHKWMDRSGFTTQSTKGQVEEATREFVLVALSAGMTYDVFLELAREGKWAWLYPAVLACKPQLEAILAKRLAA